MAAHDDQSLLRDQVLLLAHPGQVETRGLVVAVVVVGGFVGDEDVAAEVEGALERPGVAHPADGDAADFGVRVAGFEGVDGVCGFEPAAVERAKIGLEVLYLHGGEILFIHEYTRM